MKSVDQIKKIIVSEKCDCYNLISRRRFLSNKCKYFIEFLQENGEKYLTHSIGKVAFDSLQTNAKEIKSF